MRLVTARRLDLQFFDYEIKDRPQYMVKYLYNLLQLAVGRVLAKLGVLPPARVTEATKRPAALLIIT
jgi:hypothetical protein